MRDIVSNEIRIKKAPKKKEAFNCWWSHLPLRKGCMYPDYQQVK